MKLRIAWYPWVPLVVGVMSAVGAVIFMQMYIQQALDQPSTTLDPHHQNVPTRAVVVANQALSPGEVITIDALSLRHVHSLGLAVDSYHPEQLDALLGRQVRHPIQGGQPIQQLHLAEYSTQRLAQTLKEGTRAFTLSVSAEDSNAGLIQLGDHVDFFDLSQQPPRLLANRVHVVATGAQLHADTPNSQRHDWQSDEYRTLTFAVDVTQLGAFSQLHRQQQLGFWLRPVVDKTTVAVAPLTQVQWIIGRHTTATFVEPELWQ